MNAELMYTTIVQLSLLSLGASAVAVGVLFKRKPPYWWAYALTKLGLFGIVGILLYLIYPAKTIPPTGQAYFYAGCVLACTIGVLGVCRDIMLRTGRRAAKDVVERLKP